MATVSPRPAAPLVDPVVHDRVRLAMMTALARETVLTFTALKQRLDLTDGNLSVHARRLEDVGYIAVTKHGERRARRTEYRLTPAGRRALLRYVEHLEGVISTIREVVAGEPGELPTPPVA